MKRIKDITTWAVSIEDESLTEKKDFRGWLRFSARLVTYTALEFLRDQVTEMAAALTYRTIFSLIPTLVLAFLVIRAVGGFDKISDDLRERAFTYLGISQLALPPVPSAAGQHAQPTLSTSPAPSNGPDATLANPGPAEDDAATHPSSQPTTQPTTQPVLTKEQQAALNNRLETILSDLTNQVSSISFASIGGVGFFLLVWSALSLAVTVEQTFNRIYNTSIGRPWHIRITMYWAVITLGPFLMSISLYLTSRLIAIVETVGPFAEILKYTSRLAALAISWLLLFILYKLMPNTRVDSKPAAIGSFIAAFLFEAGKYFFHLYLTHFVPFAKFYGTLALLPLFLLWVYTMWIIVLSGLEFSYTLQAMLSGDFKHQYLRRNQSAFQDPRVLAVVLASIGRDFVEGKSTSARILHHRLGLSTNDVNHAIERLELFEMVHVIRNAADPTVTYYSLSKPAEKILLRDLFHAATPLSRQAGHLAIVDDKAYNWFENAENAAVGEATLATIL